MGKPNANKNYKKPDASKDNMKPDAKKGYNFEQKDPQEVKDNWLKRRDGYLMEDYMFTQEARKQLEKIYNDGPVN